MKRMRLLLAVGLVAACGFGASAIEPSHWGPYGNPEEPATRPYKAFWRGLKAFKYQLNATAREGQRKAGAYGHVQFFRGVRRGLVEIGAGTYMGMAGQYPLPVDKTHPANVYIDADRRRAALADVPSTAAIFWYAGLGSVGAVFGPGAVTIAQSEVDRHAMTPEERAEVANAASITAMQNWEPDPHARNKARPEGLKQSAAWRVVDTDPSPTQKKLVVETNPYAGDMIKKRRNGRIAD